MSVDEKERRACLVTGRRPPMVSQHELERVRPALRLRDDARLGPIAGSCVIGVRKEVRLWVRRSVKGDGIVRTGEDISSSPYQLRQLCQLLCRLMSSSASRVRGEQRAESGG